MVEDLLLETSHGGRQRILTGADPAANGAHGGGSDVSVSLANVALRQTRQAARGGLDRVQADVASQGKQPVVSFK
jgi:hypothetical protein